MYSMNKEEKVLRESIRQAIRLVKKTRLEEENKFRKIIRSFIDYELQNLNEAGQVPDGKPTPNKSTGIKLVSISTTSKFLNSLIIMVYIHAII